MSSTEYSLGLSSDRSSSRVIKPPGGASSNIFGPTEEVKPHARPKYDQQNSSNLNFCMNTVDPNVKVAQQFSEPSAEPAAPAPAAESAPSAPAHSEPASNGSAEPVKQEALPTYHHHRSTALW